MDSGNLSLVLLLIAIKKKQLKLLKLKQQRKQRRTRIWRQFCYTEKEREIHGFFGNLFKYMKEENETEFRKATRMGVTTFNLLLTLLKAKIAKEDFIRESIPAECRLAITLVYLGHGVCRQMLAWAFRVGVSTVAVIIYETCQAMWDELACIYLAPPHDDEWRRISTVFEKNTGMPHVLGAIDGKHVNIQCPPHSGTQYFNYKKYFSIVLLAVCDSEYTFTAIDVGAYGSQSDGGVLQQSSFGKKILDNTIHALPPAKLPNSDITLPYYFIGDAAFPLRENLMRPYPGKTLSSDKEFFNKRLSRARVIIENSFGILCAKWRILSKKMDMLPTNAEKIVKASAILHNFVQFHEREKYCPENYVDHFNENGSIVDGTWRQEVEPLQQLHNQRCPNASRVAFSVRESLKDYLLRN